MLPVPPMLPSHGHVPARQSESPDGPSQLIRLESPTETSPQSSSSKLSPCSHMRNRE